MRADSKELANRIDIMVAFQNSEAVQFRNLKKAALNSMQEWLPAYKNLAFDWSHYAYRITPPTPPEPRTGFIFANQLHQHPRDHRHSVSEGTCFKVREVEE